MINLFLEEVPHYAEEMLTAYTSGNFEFIRKTAHRIKPTLGNLGIVTLKDDIQTIEDLAAGQNPSDRLLELLRRTNGVVINVAGELKTYLASAV
ncbi:Hpt domain-containing protein [Puia sp. P3]|uniref:Hpt domain-containing protein n=1 Tax=Puia sp. P3 TaxID=3423952 RepID=UPI003D66B3C0